MKYLIKNKASGKKRLVEAGGRANAIAHVAKDDYSAELISDDVAEMLSLPLEKVTADKAAASEEKPGTEKDGKGGDA